MCLPNVNLFRPEKLLTRKIKAVVNSFLMPAPQNFCRATLMFIALKCPLLQNLFNIYIMFQCVKKQVGRSKIFFIFDNRNIF